MDRLLASRDPIGLSPLYWLSDRDGVKCGASFRALLEDGDVPFELSSESLHAYMHYMWVAAPNTPLRNCHSLLPGHRLLQNDETGEVRTERYWALEECLPVDGDPVPLIRERLLRGVEKAAEGRVSIGVPLSGGIDSSSIACMLRHLGVPFTAFTVGYKGRPPSDEREQAKRLARDLKVPIVEIELEAEGLLESFPDVVAASELPIADITAYAYYELFRTMNRHGVTLCLSGQGADELFWGYEWVRNAVRENELLARLAESKGRASLKDAVKLFLPIDGFRGETLRDWMTLRPFRRQWSYVKAALSRIGDTLAQRKKTLLFYQLSPVYQEAERVLPQLYEREFWERTKRCDTGLNFFFQEDVRPDLLLTGALFRSYLLENGLTLGGNIARNVGGLELGCPFLDLSLVETVVGLRRRHPDWLWGRKFWLKRAMKGLVPDYVLNRNKKQGFEPPVVAWQKALFECYGSRLVDGNLSRQRIFSEKGLKLLAEGTTPLLKFLPYNALVMEMWLEGIRLFRNRESERVHE